MNPRNPRNDRSGMDHPPRGFALLLVLIILVAAMVMATTFLSAMSTASLTGRDFNGQLKARMIAESGLELALAEVRRNANWRTAHPNGIWVLDEPYAGGTFTILVEDGQYDPLAAMLVGDGSLTDDITDPATITAAGKFDGVTHQVRSMVIPRYINAGGLSVLNGVSMSNSATVDGWNSETGVYDATNSGLNATVTTNATTSGSISLGESVVVTGHAYVGPSGNPLSAVTLTGGATISGSTGALPQIVDLETVALPQTLPLLAGPVSYSTSVTSILTSMTVPSFELTGSTIAAVDSDVTIVVQGDFRMRNSSQLRISPGATLNLYITGQFVMEQYAELNASLADPTRVNIYVLGAGPLTMENYAKLYANVRAPLAPLTMNNHAHLYGTFQGTSLTMLNNAAFHQDLNPASGSIPILTGLPSIWMEPR